MHVLLIAAVLAANTVQADTSYLYRTLLIRAAPGRLLELIEAYQDRVSGKWRIPVAEVRKLLAEMGVSDDDS